MADYSVLSSSNEFSMQFGREAGQIRCAMPGVIESFDPASQSAVVRPALSMKVNLGEGEVSQLPLPPVPAVPVVLPYAQGAGFLLTLPIHSGDECLLIFADRALDYFIQNGGVQPSGDDDDTTAPRTHSLADAICIPGIIANPQAVPDYSTENIELRDKARTSYISLGPGGIELSDGVAVFSMSGGTVQTNAPGGNYVEAPNMRLARDSTNEFSGPLSAEEVREKNGTHLGTHTHGGVVPGGGETAPPKPGA